MSDPIRILIIEDNGQYRSSLKHMIRLAEQLEFAAEFKSGEDYLSEVSSNGPIEADIILLDLHLPGKNGLQLIPTILTHQPSSHILVLTQNSDYHTTLEAIRLGVSGYLLKDSPVATLREAIIDIHDGGCIIDPQLSRIVLQSLAGHPAEGEEAVLSPREQEVLKLLSLGFVKKEVAGNLGISYRTVTQHTENIYHKLRVPNIAAAVATAIRKGLI